MPFLLNHFNRKFLRTWWRHQMETFSALLALCAENPPVTGEFPAQRPVTRNCNVFFDLRLNKQLNKQSWGWESETPSGSLWRHCNELRNGYFAADYSLFSILFHLITQYIPWIVYSVHALLVPSYLTHFLQGCFTGTGAIVGLPRCQWSNLEGYG